MSKTRGLANTGEINVGSEEVNSSSGHTLLAIFKIDVFADYEIMTVLPHHTYALRDDRIINESISHLLLNRIPS